MLHPSLYKKSNHPNQGVFPNLGTSLQSPDQVVIPKSPIFLYCPVIIFFESIVAHFSSESFSCASLCHSQKDPILNPHVSPDWILFVFVDFHIRYLAIPVQCLHGGWRHNQIDRDAAPHLQGDQARHEQETHLS